MKILRLEMIISKDNNAIDANKYFKKKQKKWLEELEEWHNKICIRNTNISWKWNLTKSSRMEYIYPHHLKPILFAATVIDYIKINNENLTLYMFPEEALDYISESLDKNKFIIDKIQKNKFFIKKDLLNIKKYFLDILRIINLLLKKLFYFRNSFNNKINPELLIISNTIDLKTLTEKGDHFFGKFFENKKENKKSNWMYILDNHREASSIKKIINNLKDYSFHLNYLNLYNIFEIFVQYFFDLYYFYKFKNNSIPIHIGPLNSNKFYSNYVLSSLNNNLIHEYSIYLAMKNYLSIIKPKRVIYPYERKGFESGILRACHLTQTEVLTIGFANAYYSNRHRYLSYINNKFFYYPKKLAITGNSLTNFFVNDRNWPQEKCFVLGSPRNNEDNIKASLLVPHKMKTILIVTGYYYELKVISNWLLSNVKKFKKYNFIIRPYPHDWQKSQQEIIDKLDRSEININISTEMSLNSQIKICDIVLFNASSAGIEAMSRDCIVVRFYADDLLELFNKNYGNEMQIKTVNNSFDLLLCLDSINKYTKKQILNTISNQRVLAQSIYSKLDIGKIYINK